MFPLMLALAVEGASAPMTHATLPSPISRYISPLDYPPAAIPQRAEGRVDLTLAVGPEGRLTGCTIRKSSGWPVLDAATCRILQRRLKFTPARDAAGQSTSDVIETSIDWHVPPPEILQHMMPRPD